jgi:hypothetical protein
MGCCPHERIEGIAAFCRGIQEPPVRDSSDGLSPLIGRGGLGASWPANQTHPSPVDVTMPHLIPHGGNTPYHLRLIQILSLHRERASGSRRHNRNRDFMKMNTTVERENHHLDQIKISHDEIDQRASQLWELAGHPVGRDAEYWLQAEAELLAAKQCVRLPKVGDRSPTRRTKQPGRAPQPSQNLKPAQIASRVQELALRR